MIMENLRLVVGEYTRKITKSKKEFLNDKEYFNNNYTRLSF